MANNAFMNKLQGQATADRSVPDPKKDKKKDEPVDLSGDGLLDGGIGMEEEEDDEEPNFGLPKSVTPPVPPAPLDDPSSFAKKIDRDERTTRGRSQPVQQNNSYERGRYDMRGNVAQSEDISSIVLDYVCRCTVSNLKETYQSKIYTEEFTKGLFDKYLAGKADSSDPLFKALISECIESKVEDPYLKEELTGKVLEYIHVN